MADRLLQVLKKYTAGFNPSTILDLGCGTGQVAKSLSDDFAESEVFALDFSKRMLLETEKRLGDKGINTSFVCADAEQLPFKAQSFDLIVSSLMLQWTNDLETTLKDLHATLSNNGILAFSSLSEGTLLEIKASWEAVDQLAHSSRFKPLASFEASAKAAGFSKINVVPESIVMSYDSIKEMLLEMKGIGASNANNERFRGLTGKQRFEAFERAFESYRLVDGRYPCSWEIVYAFCSK